MNPLTSLLSPVFLPAYLALGTIVSSAALAADGGKYTITEVRPFGQTYVVATKINDAGDIVGYWMVDDGQWPYTFLLRAGTTQPLVLLNGGYPVDMNNQGDVVCYSVVYPPYTSTFFYRDGSNLDLAKAVSPSFLAKAMNDRGDILGYYSGDGYGPIVYNHLTGSIRTLAAPVGHVEDINNDGAVVGYGGSVDSVILWPTNYSQFEMLEGVGWSSVRVINNVGQVGGISYDPEFARPQGFVYDRGDVTWLGALRGDDSSYVNGMNDNGVVIGASWDSSVQVFHPFIYQNHKMRDLNELIPKGTGWVLREPLSINNQGQIVGYGILDGEIRGFLLTPMKVAKKDERGAGK